MNTLVVARGGLGNQLFMLASALAFRGTQDQGLQVVDAWYQRESRRTPISHSRRDFLLHRFPAIRELFPVAGIKETLVASATVTSYTRLGLRAPWLVLEDGAGRPDRSPRSMDVMYGYFQASGYFEHLHDLLCHLLTPDDEDEASARQSLDAAVSSGAPPVAIHVRRGDHIAALRSGVVLAEDYVQRALETLNVDESQVVVFSDSPGWCRANPVFRKAAVVDEPDPVRALRMMQLCPTLIMSPSTLSWWAAWASPIANRRIVAPQPFIEPENPVWEANVASTWERLEARFAPGDNPGVTR